MPLTKAQLMPPPGGPGVIGAIKAGQGIVISPDGTISQGGGGMPTGTRMFFFSATAPEGWTKITAGADDRALRLTSGSGGRTGGLTNFSDAFTAYSPDGVISINNFTFNTSLTPAQLSEGMLGPHAHSFIKPCESGSSGRGPGTAGVPTGCSNTTGSSGSNQAHTHSFTGNVSGGGSYSPIPTEQFSVLYVDILLCEKS